MAIEIIPKPEERRPAFLMNIFFFLGITLLVLSIAGYGYLQYSIRNTSQHLKNLGQEILDKRTPEVENLEREILSWRPKIEDYNLIFTSHKAPTNLFEFLEKVTHPNIWWVDFDLDLTSSSNNLKLKGVSKDFTSLQQQLIVFGQETSIKQITLNQLSLAKGGGAEFDLVLSVDPNVFSPKISSPQ